jgi:uncharacterized protein
VTSDATPRHAVRAAVLAYAAAFALSILTTGWVVTLAARRSHAGGGLRAFAVSRTGLLLGAAVEGLTLLGVAVLAAVLQSGGVRRRLRWRASGVTFGTRAAAAVALVGCSVAYGAAADLAGARGGMLRVAAGALGKPSPGEFLAALVAVALVPAIGEESLFRGFIQGCLTPVLGRWPGIVATSAAFGVLHRDPLQGTGAFLAGLLLGWTVERTGGLGPSIAAHAVNNATFVVLASLGAADGGPRAVEVASVVAGGAAFAAGARVVARASRRAS